MGSESIAHEAEGHSVFNSESKKNGTRANTRSLTRTISRVVIDSRTIARDYFVVGALIQRTEIFIS